MTSSSASARSRIDFTSSVDTRGNHDLHRDTSRGAYLIDLEKRGDDRGFFARAFCEKEFGNHGLVTRFVQINNSLSAQQGTLRGMHYQLAPRPRPRSSAASAAHFTT